MHSQFCHHNFPQIESAAKILRGTNEDQAPKWQHLTFKTLAMAMAASQSIPETMWRDREYNS
jgi:hypothetical protein